MEFFDSHAHLSSEQLWSDIEVVLARANENKVNKILNICTNPEELERGLILQKKYSGIENAAATTPHDVQKEGESAFPIFAKAAEMKKIAAVGETGLDYHYEHSPKEMQRKFLVRYLHLAAECSLPVIFHCRDAFEDLFSICDQEYPKQCKAVLHCFTGTIEEAEEVLKRGWYLSLSGIATFKKSQWLREVAKIVPLSQLLIETDAPYLAPQSQRGKRNEPAFVVETAECIAKEKGITLEQIAKATLENGKKLFSF